MAKAATKVKPDEPKTPAPPPADEAKTKEFSWGGSTFVIERHTPIPAAAKAPRGMQELPFKALFDQMQDADHIFLPNSFWAARGVKEDDITSAYVRSKVRAAFKAWQAVKEDERKHHALYLYPRQKGEDSGKYAEPGFSIFMAIEAPGTHKADAPAKV